MENLATLLKRSQEANRNMVKFIKNGDDEAAIMWANKLEELEQRIENGDHE